MSDIAIRCEGLSKQYRIGQQERYRALRDVIADTAATPFRLLRSRLKPSNGNGSSISNGKSPKADGTIWALENVSFEINRGEVVGIIGRNGAGKSTLLKILSRITKPTRSHAEINGRVGSLLEVGTGFHPELTGRENIYLNGAILGMRKAEIDRRFDEIVAFAEVEKFVDTPVKRYSSGMYVRLAFAVAAHMETEVLLVDEVLAVGDAEFQKKCLGKMGEVSRKGRTVIFVSHNMQSIAQLTAQTILLNQGTCEFYGPTTECITRYTQAALQDTAQYAAPAEKENYVETAAVYTSAANGLHYWGQPITFEFTLRITKPSTTLCFSFQVVNDLQIPICHFWLFDSDVPYRQRAGRYLLRCEVPRLRLYLGQHTLTTWLSDRRSYATIENLSQICPFQVSLSNVSRAEYQWQAKDCTYLEDFKWTEVKALD